MQAIKKIAFHSYQTINDERKAIYHTNVYDGYGRKIMLFLCADSIDNLEERAAVINELEKDKKRNSIHK